MKILSLVINNKSKRRCTKDEIILNDLKDKPEILIEDKEKTLLWRFIRRWEWQELIDRFRED